MVTSLSMINCVIAQNTAVYFGGGLACLQNSSVTLMNCTVARNTAGPVPLPYFPGSAIVCGLPASVGPDLGNSRVTATNTIFADNPPVAIWIGTADSHVTASHCLFHGNQYDFVDANGTPSSGTAGDPLFYDEGLGDYRLHQKQQERASKDGDSEENQVMRNRAFVLPQVGKNEFFIALVRVEAYPPA